MGEDTEAYFNDRFWCDGCVLHVVHARVGSLTFVVFTLAGCGEGRSDIPGGSWGCLRFLVTAARDPGTALRCTLVGGVFVASAVRVRPLESVR